MRNIVNHGRATRSLLLGLGSCCVILALLLPLYVYPRLAVLPADPAVTEVVSGRHMTVLAPLPASRGGLRVLRDVTATSTTHLSQDAAGAVQDPPSIVWRAATRTMVEGYGMIGARVEVISLNRRSSQPTNCCGDRLITDMDDDTGTPLRHEGYYAWPFDVQKRTYQLWDVNLRGARPLVFSGTEMRDGVLTYRFRGTVLDRSIGSQPLPGSLFGRQEASVVAKSRYSSDKTLWVEPNSGAVLDYRESIDEYFVVGTKVVHAFTGVMQRVPPTGSDPAVDGARSAWVLPWIRTRLTVPLLLLGLALLAVGGRQPATTPGFGVGGGGRVVVGVGR